uniref:Tripartite motif containing 25 n=1 Tax=Mastacembelus armatus TaxID=205130 RepID=A0A3Q3L4E7_9TELE
MAELEENSFSLMSLEDDLTCSICLSTFNCPVTIPCGHNFCQDCLLATWKESYSCPQCRTLFPIKPELKKNTVLSAVVETFMVKASKNEAASLYGEEKQAEKKDAIRCDTCMEADAAQTCLTCMASFCGEHLRPHRENPIFRSHQLSEPVGDLLDRICPDHHKLMEFFCSQHSRPICSFCLQQVHKGCSFISPEEQRNLKESDLRGKLGVLDGKIMRNETVLSQMQDLQKKLKEAAINRKKTVAAEYQQIRDMLGREERDALNSVDRELESGQNKLRTLMKKFTENIDNMSKAKEDIHSQLSRSQTQAFLQASLNLPPAVNFEPYAPRINLDSKKVTMTQGFAVALKCFEIFTLLMKQLIMLFFLLEQTKKDSQTTEDKMENKTLPRLMDNLLDFSGKDKPSCSSAAEPSQTPGRYAYPSQSNLTGATPTYGNSNHVCYLNGLSCFLDGTILILDAKTTHKRITLSEGLTKAAVSDEHTDYPDCPERFTVCSQVLASKGFSRGRHYWEVRLSSSNFIGIGLAYGSIDRKGPASRLGRNAQSWCVEWFNVKLSAWHNNSETVLVNPNPKRVGILLNCEEGVATFYSVADRAYPFHTFVFPFAEAVYPAFWIFSSGSSISLCKLQA